MSTTHLNADDMNVPRTGNQDVKTTTAGSSVMLPYLDTNEINKKLEEHSKLLKEWEDLLNRTATPDVHNISQADAQRHIFLKRKLHESLGIMARIVQNQIKLKKTSTDVQISSAPPVMVAASGSGNYVPVATTASTTGTTAPSGMLLSSINYAPDSQQPVTGMPYTNPYSYQNGYLTAMPVQTSAVDGVPQYYNYAPNMNNQNSTQSGQIQPIQSQMYVPQYQMAANNPSVQTTANGSGTGTAYNTMNYAPSYAQTGVSYATSQPVVLQPTPSMQAYSNNGNNSNLPNTQSQQAAQNPQQGYAAYYTTPGGDGSTMMYSQQMLSQVPMSYYGNSSVVPTTTAGVGASATAMSQQQQQPQYVLPPQQHQQQQHAQTGISSGSQSHERFVNSAATGNMQPNINNNHMHSVNNMSSQQQQQVEQQQQKQ